MLVNEFRVRYPDVYFTQEQLACCHYLERQGQTFLIHFGYQNAPDKVWGQLDREIELKEETEQWLGQV